MKKKSHMLLGKYLTALVSDFPAQRYEKAFLFGCVEPDYNLFTFLKGSFKVRMLCGHNFSNSEQHILRTIEKLQQKRNWWLLEYYQLGRLIHYISDAFTSPHNHSYSVAAHALYEINLHGHLERGIAAALPAHRSPGADSVTEHLLSTHRRYQDESKGPGTDVQYILSVAGLVFAMLMPDMAASFDHAA